MRGALENLFAFLLGHAAEHPKLLSLFLKLLVVGEAVEDFLLGFVANGAGVVEDEVGFIDGRNLAVALGDERPNDFFGVMDVHLAAKSFEVKSLVGAHTHGDSIK